MGGRDHGIDPHYVDELARSIKDVAMDTGVQIAIVVGGGNIMRGAAIAKNGTERATGDYIGMMATVMNGMALLDAFERNGQPARLQSRLVVQSVTEPYIRRRAIKHMERGRIVIVSGGTGTPYVTTDTAAVSAGLELDCDAVLKATKVDGVYDKDPAKHDDAVKIEALTHHDALTQKGIKVMDKAAISLALENAMPLIVFDSSDRENISRIVRGENVGTFVDSPDQD